MNKKKDNSAHSFTEGADIPERQPSESVAALSEADQQRFNNWFNEWKKTVNPEADIDEAFDAIFEYATKYERAKQAERSEQFIESIRYRDGLIKERDALQSEKAKLREALEAIMKLDCLSHGLIDASKIAQAALTTTPKP